MVVRRALFIILMLIISTGSTAFASTPAKSPEAMPRFNGDLPTDVVDSDTLLFFDDGDPQYYFPLPDVWDDHYFNIRFTAPDSCKLLRADFYFINIDTTGLEMPDINVYLWPSTGLYPDTPAGQPDSANVVVSVSGSDIVEHPEATTVEFNSADSLLTFSIGQQFHIGWDPAEEAPADTIIAILADDGIPETTNSVEWWGGEVNAWGTLANNWNLGVNFMVRAYVELLIDTTAVVELRPDVIPQEFALRGPHPNPFNPETTLTLELNRAQDVMMRVYDLNGRLVETLTEGFLPAGIHQIRWQPENLASGTYLVKTFAGDHVQVSRAVLLK